MPKKVKILNKRNMTRVEKAAKKVKDGDLYRLLHCVGDDPVKLEIEDALRELLSEVTFKQVVAVFAVACSDE
jgi:hypothetical protein